MIVFAHDSNRKNKAVPANLGVPGFPYTQIVWGKLQPLYPQNTCFTQQRNKIYSQKLVPVRPSQVVFLFLVLADSKIACGREGFAIIYHTSYKHC